MLRTIGYRILVFIPSMLFASMVVFGLVFLIPGGVAASIAGPEASPEQLAELERQLGLDRPPHEQYLSWLFQTLSGDLGTSYINGANITQQLLVRAPVTFELTLWALAIALVIGVTSGVIAAAYRGRFPDMIVMRGSGLGVAVPEFWIGMLSILLFAVTLRWVPATNIVPWEAGAGEHVRSIILPAIVLSIGASSIISRITRSSMIEVLSSPYVRTAWASGLRPISVYPKLALKNVAIPVITVIGLVLGNLLGGAVLVERIFNIPGLGSFMVNAALTKDVPAIQASLLLVVVLVMVVNLLVDLSYSVLDPRTRGSRRA